MFEESGVVLRLFQILMTKQGLDAFEWHSFTSKMSSECMPEGMRRQTDAHLNRIGCKLMINGIPPALYHKM